MPILVIAGSGEFTESMLKIDKYLLSLAKKPVLVAIIPTASVPDKKEKEWADMGIKHFKKLGVETKAVIIRNKKDANKKENLEKIARTSFIYFSGGHPGFLYQVFENSKAWKLISEKYNNGTILAGSSAGAMIFGGYLLGNAQESFDQGLKPIWLKGFDFVPYTIFPHYDWAKKYKSAELKKLLDSAAVQIKKNWLGIDEDTVLIVKDNNQEVRGKGTITINKNKRSVTYRFGQKFLL